MRLQMTSLLAVVAGLAIAATPVTSAYADRGRGSDDRQPDDRGGRGGDDRRDDDRSSGGGSGGSQANSNNARDLRFVARMRDGDGTTARARYRERDRNGRALKQSFDVEIKRAQPGEQFEVRVDGRVVGTVTANSFGFGKLELRQTPDSPNDQPIPSDFPRLRSGAVITVGSMQGTLAVGN